MQSVVRHLSKLGQKSWKPASVSVRRLISNQPIRESSSKFLHHAVVLGVVGSGLGFAYIIKNKVYAKSVLVEKSEQISQELREYSKDEVAQHNNMQSGVWVTYQGDVYDITDFIDSHPGGSSKIILAAGGALEPYWNMYGVHKKDEVYNILSEYKIGTLKEFDQISVADDNDPYSKDPQRHAAFLVRSKKPFNAETPAELLIDHFNTPNDIFYVRNHLPVPDVDPRSYSLEISGVGVKTVTLSLDELKTKFPKHTITATIQCAGNRRGDMVEVKPVKGLHWEGTAIGNAEWSGALLYDVLKYASLTEDGENEVKHVEFVGLDCDMTKTPYAASIPAHKALNKKGDVLLAYEMNGTEIPLDHGFPVRAVVPGVVGARNVKWVGKVVTRKDESNGHWQQNDYKGFSPCVDWHNVDFKSAPAIQELPVQSAICEPAEGSVMVGADEITIKGYAWSGGGRDIVRVDVSADGGKTWQVANLKKLQQADQKAWAWTLWETNIPLDQSTTGKVELVCKAVDSSYNVQPDTVEPIWNLRGVLSHAWHKVTVDVHPEE